MGPTVSSTSHLSDDLMLLHLLQIEKGQCFLTRIEYHFQLKLILKLFVEFRDQIVVSNINLIGGSQKVINHKLFIGLSTERELLMSHQISASNNTYVFLHVTEVY